MRATGIIGSQALPNSQLTGPGSAQQGRPISMNRVFNSS